MSFVLLHWLQKGFDRVIWNKLMEILTRNGLADRRLIQYKIYITTEDHNREKTGGMKVGRWVTYVNEFNEVMLCI